MLSKTTVGLQALLLITSLARATNGQQQPLVIPGTPRSEYYEFSWPIRKVAIIGAGPGGLINYREFIRAGFEVKVFERDTVPGGNWHYTEELPLDAPIPNTNIAVADFAPTLPPKNASLPYEEHYSGQESGELLRAHRAPKPIWASLHSNGPSATQQITELPWPIDTPWGSLYSSAPIVSSTLFPLQPDVTQWHLQRYLRSFASYHGLNSNDDNPNISYNTRVELVEKRYGEAGERVGWRLTLKQLQRTGPQSSKVVWTQEDFDAVVVASGRFNAPNMPGIPGLKAWGERFPGRLIHSRQYRRPEAFANQTVLVVGAAASGAEISRDLTPHTKHVLTCVRPYNDSTPEGALKNLFLRRVPANVTIIGEIKEFLPPTDTISSSQFVLTNGTVITGVDSIIFATGYRYTFPFLPEFHGQVEEENPRPLVTDGSHIRGLYRGIFSIEEPTLGFINMNVGIQSFYLSEYFAVALSKVWAGKAKLPATARMWEWCEDYVRREGGYSKYIQFLGSAKMNDLIRFLIGWLNNAAAEYGGRQLDCVDPRYEQIGYYWAKARYALEEQDVKPAAFSMSADSVGQMSIHEYASIYNDYW